MDDDQYANYVESTLRDLNWGGARDTSDLRTRDVGSVSKYTITTTAATTTATITTTTTTTSKTTTTTTTCTCNWQCV